MIKLLTCANNLLVLNCMIEMSPIQHHYFPRTAYYVKVYSELCDLCHLLYNTLSIPEFLSLHPWGCCAKKHTEQGEKLYISFIIEKLLDSSRIPGNFQECGWNSYKNEAHMSIEVFNFRHGWNLKNIQTQICFKNVPNRRSDNVVKKEHFLQCYKFLIVNIIESWKRMRLKNIHRRQKN